MYGIVSHERCNQETWDEKELSHEERKSTMQQATDSHKYSPQYIDKLILYFSPSGAIIVRIGNQYVIATASEVAELVKGRLDQHELFAQLYNRSDREGETQ
jgi:hypothetical protein